MRMTIPEKLEGTVSKYPDDIAVIFNDLRITYRSLNEMVNKLANGLRSLEVKKEDKIAIIFPNCPQFIISYLAIVKLGATVVPINFLFKAEEVSYILDNSDAKILITLSNFKDLAAGLSSKIKSIKKVIISSKEKVEGDLLHFEKILQEQPSEIKPVDINPVEDVASILYTSGTTGKPKGAMLTHKNLVFDTESCIEAIKVTPADRFICVLPLFHSFAATVCMLIPLFLGESTMLITRFVPKEVLGKIAAERASIFVGVPSMYMVWANMEPPDLDLSSWRLAISSGAPMPVEVLKRFEEKYQIKIYEGDGPTECSPVTSINPIGGIRKIGSIGLPIRGVQMKIADDNDNEVTRGEVGEIVVKGDNVMKGYYKNPEATAEAIKDGWFHTGDLGKEDEDGYFYIVDRKKDRIIVGGLNVYPREVEEVLHQHPKIAEVAVIGVPDELRGEMVKALIVLKPDETATPLEVIKYCRDRLASFKVPRQMEFRDELPKGPTGKILKRALREK